MHIHFTSSLAKEVFLSSWDRGDYVSILLCNFSNKIALCVTGLYFIASALVIFMVNTWDAAL